MFVISGARVDVKGVKSASFLDDARFHLASEDRRARETKWIRGIVLHTRMGIWPQKVVSKSVSVGWDEILVRRWTNDGRKAGAHIAIDGDGSFVCMADLARDVTFHAGQVNEYTIGIEIYQEADGTVHTASLETAVLLVDELTRVFGIQRQVPKEMSLCTRFANPVKSTDRRAALAYLPHGRCGRDFVGVYGHRNVTRNRGRGDPGDAILAELVSCGYEPFTVDSEQDFAVWSSRQSALGIHPDECDGVPGPRTLTLLAHKGHKRGMWVPRPGD